MFYYVDFFVFFVLRHWWVSQVYTQAEQIWSAKKDIKTNYTCITTVKLILRERRSTRISGRKSVQSTDLDIMNGPVYSLCALALGLALHIFTALMSPKSLTISLAVECRIYGLLFWKLDSVNHSQALSPLPPFACFPSCNSNFWVEVTGWR